MQSRGADPNIQTEDYDPYLNPGKKTPREVAIDDDEIQDALEALEQKYQEVRKSREPHPDIGCWWTLYDYGLEAVSKWRRDYVHPYPGKSMHFCSAYRRHYICRMNKQPDFRVVWLLYAHKHFVH